MMGNERFLDGEYKTIKFSKKEVEVILVQLGSRIDAFNVMLKQAAEKDNFDRVREIMDYQEILKSIQSKCYK
jgi:hypothetical protein